VNCPIFDSKFHEFKSCLDPVTLSNMKTAPRIGTSIWRFLISMISVISVLPSCLHTYFDNGTAGLASVGTLCRKTKNTGFITLLNHGQEVSLNESTLTLAHELAHNFGAGHDDEIELKDQNCGGIHHELNH